MVDHATSSANTVLERSLPFNFYVKKFYSLANFVLENPAVWKMKNSHATKRTRFVSLFSGCANNIARATSRPLALQRAL